MQQATNRPESSVAIAKRHQRPITGARLGYRGVIGAVMLQDGATYAQVRKMTGLSEHSIHAIKHHRILEDQQHLVNAVRKTYADQLLLRGKDAQELLAEKKHLLNPARASSLWKIAKEAKEAYDAGQGSKTQDIADILRQLGFQMSASISKIEVKIEQAPVSACDVIDSPTEESTS